MSDFDYEIMIDDITLLKKINELFTTSTSLVLGFDKNTGEGAVYTHEDISKLEITNNLLLIKRKDHIKTPIPNKSENDGFQLILFKKIEGSDTLMNTVGTALVMSVVSYVENLNDDSDQENDFGDAAGIQPYSFK